MASQSNEDAIFFEGPDYADAVIGLSHDDRLVYSYDRMIEHLMVNNDFSMDEAIEYIDFNTIESISHLGAKAPIVVYDFFDQI